MPCYRGLADDSRFATIRDKVVLGPTSSSETRRVAQITERPTRDEAVAIAAWRSAREECHRLEKPYFATRDSEIQATANRYFAALHALIAELEAAKLTYGEFGRRRQELYEKFNRDVEEIRKSIIPPVPIPHKK